MPMACLYCKLWICFTLCSSVSIIKLEQVNAGWAKNKWGEDFTCKEDKQKIRFYEPRATFAKSIHSLIHLLVYSFMPDIRTMVLGTTLRKRKLKGSG